MSKEGSETEAGTSPSIDVLLDVPLKISVELGRRTMTVAEVLNLGAGAVVELTKPTGEALDVYVNNRLIARGEAVMVGERYGVRISSVLPAREQMAGISADGGQS